MICLLFPKIKEKSAIVNTESNQILPTTLQEQSDWAEWHNDKHERKHSFWSSYFYLYFLSEQHLTGILICFMELET